ncbi:MAG: hypothetical protein M1833_007228 [Piccolia ochrophora]|nr:MAG: hypothetical protein M1833_007228 [Piccolia ochrophora]
METATTQLVGQGHELQLRRRARPRVDDLQHLSDTRRNNLGPAGIPTLRKLALSFFRFDVWTLEAFYTAAYDSEPRLIGIGSLEDYEQLMDARLAQSKDFLTESEARFEDELEDCSRNLSDDQVLESVRNLRTTPFYRQSMGLLVTLYGAAKSELSYVESQPSITIPESKEWCKTPQGYLRHLHMKVGEARRRLKAVVKESRYVRDTIKSAVVDDVLDEKTLMQVKGKTEALQEYFREACLAIDEPAEDLIDRRARWWESGNELDPHSRPHQALKGPSEAYDSSLKMTATLSFLVPTISLLSCIPAALAWSHASPEVGAANDAEFYQLVSTTTMQVLGIITLIWPTVFHAHLARLSDAFWAPIIMEAIDPHALPGWGKPLNFTPYRLFPNALLGDDEKYLGNAVTLVEIAMLALMNQITDKPQWERKVFDGDIVAKWRAETESIGEIKMTPKMFDWCIAELKEKAGTLSEHGIISVLNTNDLCVCKSDRAIPQELEEALVQACLSLENVPENAKDWHPHSDQKVLDLVHPSLYPLIYGRSRILRGPLDLKDCISRAGEGEVIAVPSEQDGKHPSPGTRSRKDGLYSRKFQWLPCEVAFLEGGNDMRIVSYINNLQPTHSQSLYSVLEKIIARVIPLWNLTLTPLQHFWPKSRRIDDPEWIHFAVDGDAEEPPELDSENEDDYDTMEREWNVKNRQPIHPEPGDFGPTDVRTIKAASKDPLCNEMIDMATQKVREGAEFDLQRSHPEGLQVIVKLASIHLTPDKAEYEGGTWHVEGQCNEHICASAIYYYDCDNITESRLSFRKQVTEEGILNYEQDDHQGPEAIYGIENGESAVQVFGDVLTKEGRLVTFPNNVQHQVQPFRLSDPTKPGHRKILALFLVDPCSPVISTANVPCQQESWWSEQVRERDLLTKVPAEILQIIKDVSSLTYFDQLRKYVGVDRIEYRLRGFLCLYEKQKNCDWSLWKKGNICELSPIYYLSHCLDFGD